MRRWAVVVAVLSLGGCQCLEAVAEVQPDGGVMTIDIDAGHRDAGVDAGQSTVVENDGGSRCDAQACARQAGSCVRATCVADQCRFESLEGNSCDDDSNMCTFDHCRAGVCTHTLNPACTCQSFAAVGSALLDEEFPTLARADRIHIRDDATSCGGSGRVRSLVRWDVSSLIGAPIANARVRFTYTGDFGQPPASGRSISIHQVLSGWNAATWSTPPSSGALALGSQVLSPVVGQMVMFSVPRSVVQGWTARGANSEGLLLRFTDENCVGARWPAELDRFPVLDVNCE